MKMFKTTGAVGLNAGAMVLLTPAQAESRAAALLPVKPKAGLYQVKNRIEFKSGETFGFDGDLPKSMAELVEPEVAKGSKGGDKKVDNKPVKTTAELEAESRAQAEQEALAAWDKDAELRERHGNDFPTYMASLANPS
jgi:hypothetical protein